MMPTGIVELLYCQMIAYDVISCHTYRNKNQLVSK